MGGKAQEISDDFHTPEELQDLLERIGMRLHAKNRIAGGESVFLWHLAETLRATGRMAVAKTYDPELGGKFEDEYEPGSIPNGDRLKHFMATLKNEMAQDSDNR
ncbi:hypothetical protein [Roseovarius sp. Pro17]|uniref:hypothetical protein n=1 Tax=Roseovarius sp. Pro17 TaxID=3108175 RepID=UPI002D76E5F2|nr:hypothetical protein [Roseovarius sp. Pro17]